jgi:thymidylate synthase (FAD)
MRQWMRHRTWSYNEVSARYTELPEEFYVPSELLKQGTGNKQMSGEPMDDEDQRIIRNAMTNVNLTAFAMYKDLLKRGVSRELARTVLPLATYTRLFATVDLHNLLGFIRLRLHPHAQKEIQVYAKALLELIQPIVPHSVKAFENVSKVSTS